MTYPPINYQQAPLIVQQEVSITTFVLRLLGVLLGLLHTVTCFVFLVMVYDIYSTLSDLKQQMDNYF